MPCIRYGIHFCSNTSSWSSMIKAHIHVVLLIYTRLSVMRLFGTASTTQIDNKMVDSDTVPLHSPQNIQAFASRAAQGDYKCLLRIIRNLNTSREPMIHYNVPMFKYRWGVPNLHLDPLIIQPTTPANWRPCPIPNIATRLGWCSSPIRRSQGPVSI